MLVLVGCGVGDPDEMVPNPTGRQCSAALSTSGTFAPDTAHPQPIESSGCWPYGTWTFKATVDTNDCSPAPTLLAQYQFRGDYSLNEDMDPVQTFVYMTEPTAHHTVKVSQGGSGLCEGELEIFSTDGTEVLLLKPELNADNSITGLGEFSVFAENQWTRDP